MIILASLIPALVLTTMLMRTKNKTQKLEPVKVKAQK
jgi:hypothetical protein